MTTYDDVGTDQDLWHVEVAPNDVRVVTLDQLDQAFQDGIVTDSMRVWQEGMPCAVSLGELLGVGDEDGAGYEEQPAHYAEPQYAQPQYAQPQYAQPQYAQPQYAQPQYARPQYAQPEYTAPVQYAPPQYLPARSAPPPSRAPESSWPPVIARSETPPPVSYPPASAPVPPSMAPMALDIGDFDIQYPRSGGKGKFLLAAMVLLAAGGFVAFQKRADLGFGTPTVAAAAVQIPAPPPQPVSHAYDPGPPVKLGESKPPIALTVRDEPKADDKKVDDTNADKKLDAKKVMASGKKPKPAPRTHRSAPSKPAGSGFKLGKSGSKYDPLNGSL